jgi:hypothetical protein
MRCFAVVLGTLAVLNVVPVAVQSDRPLPDLDTFIGETRTRLQLDEDQQAGYFYVETRREIQLDGSGQPKGESVKVFENYPGVPGEGRWERLVSEDGRPVPAEELAEAERKRVRKAQELTRKFENLSDDDRAKMTREYEKQQREFKEMMDDAFRVFDVQMIGRETVGGHNTIALSLTPRRNAKTETRIGGMLRHFQGRVSISESDYQLVGLDVEALDDATMGFGLLARIHRGTRFSMERKKVDGNVWLPARTAYNMSVRMLLFRRMRINTTSEFSSYRKFSASIPATDVTPATFDPGPKTP